MKHYALDTYHGPLVISQRRDDWVVSSPYRPPEIFDGSIPPDCVLNARKISMEEAVSMLADCSAPLWHQSDIAFQSGNLYSIES